MMEKKYSREMQEHMSIFSWRREGIFISCLRMRELLLPETLVKG